MTQFLKRAFLTAFFALFAAQASAMFIQADWFDPTKPGVGTNRYSYCFNDPINCIDPNGNDAIRQNEDGSYTSSDGTTYDPNTRESSYDSGEDAYPDYRAQQEVEAIVKAFPEYNTPELRKGLAALANSGLRDSLLNQAAARSGESVMGRSPLTNPAVAAAGVAGVTALARGRGKLPTRGGVATPTLPTYDGKTTVGVVQIGNRTWGVQSGMAGGPGMMLRNDPSIKAGNVAWTHAEGHAAAIMRMNGAKSADLYINNPNGVCGYCNSVIKNMIPSGSTLRVHYPGGTASYP